LGKQVCGKEEVDFGTGTSEGVVILVDSERKGWGRGKGRGREAQLGKEKLKELRRRASDKVLATPYLVQIACHHQARRTAPRTAAATTAATPIFGRRRHVISLLALIEVIHSRKVAVK